MFQVRTKMFHVKRLKEVFVFDPADPADPSKPTPPTLNFRRVSFG